MPDTLTDLPVLPPRPEPNVHGYVSKYVCSSGTLVGLAARLQNWVHRLGTDRTLPFPGLGLIRDLEIAVRLLNLREFAEWLKVNGPSEHQEFADEILQNEETLDAVGDALRHAGHDHDDPVRAVEKLDGEVRQVDDIRKVLVEAGALEESDHDTPLPDLLRALLS